MSADALVVSMADGKPIVFQGAPDANGDGQASTFSGYANITNMPSGIYTVLTATASGATTGCTTEMTIVVGTQELFSQSSQPCGSVTVTVSNGSLTLPFEGDDGTNNVVEVKKNS